MTSPEEVEILLVEDNPSDVDLTLRALEKAHIANTIHVVHDGEEALEYLFGEGRYAGRDISAIPKVIFLDLKLPKVDGLTVLRRIKSDEKTRVIPIVVLTSSEQERDVINTYTFGVNSYVVKPIDFDKFSKAIAQIGLYWLLLNKPPRSG